MFVVVKYLFYFTVFPRILSKPDINLYHTKRISESDESAIQHHCLRVTASIDQAHISRHIISYCMDEFSIEKTSFYPKLTFAELLQQNVTSEHPNHSSYSRFLSYL